MTRRRRSPRAFALAGLALCLLMAVAGLLNRWWEYYGVTDAIGTTIFVSRGALGISWVEGQSWFSTGTRIVAYAARSPSAALNAWPGAPTGSPWQLWPAFDQNRTFHTATLPLWIPLVLIGVPSFVAWWRIRHRPPPGHCRHCGYNLTGNTSGRCPECGRTISDA